MPRKYTKPSQKKSFPVWIIALVVVALLVIAGVVIASQPQPAVIKLPAEISVSQAAQAQKDGAYILDVREPSEWVVAHISGATLIPLGDLPNRLNEVPKNREVVVVCRTGHRSAQGRDILLQAGFTQVTSMAGGLTEWQVQGLPVATGQ
jgi:rhodanese-related sulfurtransferase